MSYQVLARRWRPRTFAELVGQEHVVRPLANALDKDRLHHAFLFTGTRGVGKTTIARILAKALNCEQGVSATPCGQCGSCTSIDEGRFVDLIEVDAASRTKVEDTRDLLDNVQYAPTRGRYKVYLIHEVHMLSNHSFNALLKTLEEPPPHVKFLLATTDPQRLPVTILSRCLQFSLKRLSGSAIADYLATVLSNENIAFEESALPLIGRAGDGSLRDALSLLDQSIAYGAGAVRCDDVVAMLGLIDQRMVERIFDALADADINQALGVVAELDVVAPNYENLLADMASWLQRMALVQLASDIAIDSAVANEQVLRQLAKRFSPEDVQLYYQIALHGRRDLPLAPDPRCGFEMALLRMFCFAPQRAGVDARPTIRSSPVKDTVAHRAPGAGTPGAGPARPTAPARPRAAGAEHAKSNASSAEVSGNQVASASHLTGSAIPATPPADTDASGRLVTPASNSPPDRAAVPDNNHPAEPNASYATEWPVLVEKLGLTGIAKQLALNCAFESVSDTEIVLLLDSSHNGMRTESTTDRLTKALANFFRRPMRLTIRNSDQSIATPAKQIAADNEQRRLEAVELIDQDPNVKALRATFDAEVRIDSITPTD